ncbi:hypothetical protein GWI33_011038 [Rhynchophorus ferrugineus]|uniref:Uncharacterized protein n=1 Tax=Rhynchophorus ferrugineus TaxID=354439 RepID=A0A834MF16_RHYFE|nr:hypothetical protein GWI33_011038 [Rhynchophorus ferrugineus]
MAFKLSEEIDDDDNDGGGGGEDEVGLFRRGTWGRLSAGNRRRASRDRGRKPLEGLRRVITICTPTIIDEELCSFVGWMRVRHSFLGCAAL